MPCLYTALDPRGAIAEFEKHYAEYAAPAERDLVSVDVQVSPVLDLTNPTVRSRLGVDQQTLVGDTATDLAKCRAMAKRWVGNGGAAILAPSAALPGAVNLLIYLESTAGIATLNNGPDRVRITHGSGWPPT